MFSLKTFIYRVLKRYYIFVQKYNLSSNSSQLFTMFILIVIVWLAGSTLTVLNEYIWGTAENQNIYYYLKFYTLTIKTILSADFGDFENYTTMTLILSIVMVIIGIVIIGLFTGQIISVLISVIDKNKYLPEKPINFCFNSPVLVCNKSANIKNIILELKKSELLNDREIIIINEEANKIENTDRKALKNVFQITGNPVDQNILNIALSNNKNGKKRKISRTINAIVLKDNQEISNYSDFKSIEIALALESYNKNIHTVVELDSDDNKYLFEKTFIDELITVKEYGIKLLSQSALNNGITKVYEELLIKNYHNLNSLSNSIFITKLSEIGLNQNVSYEQISNFLKQNNTTNSILMGFQKHISRETLKMLEDTFFYEKFLKKLNKSNYFDQVNPTNKANITVGHLSLLVLSDSIFLSKKTILDQNDKIIYISRTKIKKENIYG